METCFKQILYYGQWQRVFCLVETIFFYSYFLETIIAVTRRPIFFKKKLFLPVETVFFYFFRHCFAWKQFFGPEKRILHSGKWKRIFGKLQTLYLFRTFFCWWTPFLKLSVYRFSSTFSIANTESSFSS